MFLVVHPRPTTKQVSGEGPPLKFYETRDNLLVGLGSDTTQPEDIIELRRLLYGLYAVLRLHNAQEEEGAFSPRPTAPAPSGR